MKDKHVSHSNLRGVIVMKKLSKTLAAILLVMVMVVLLAGPSFAYENWSSFPPQQMGNYNSFTYGVQAMMYRYSYSTNYVLYTNGGIDGIYGPATAQSVTNYQNARGLTPDGKVGQQETWPSLWSVLYAAGTDPTYTYTYYKISSAYLSTNAIARKVTVVGASAYSTWYGMSEAGTDKYYMG